MTAPVRLLPPIPPAMRWVLAGLVVAMLVYVMVVIESPPPAKTPDDEPRPSVTLVPELDRQILAKALDATREQRLVLEVEPLRHLLAKAIDVGPTVAVALGVPERPVPVADLRADPAAFRQRWLWYEGVLEELSGARDGHPIKGHAIYEATVKLADGERVFAAFSLAPEAGIAIGKWVRVEGYLLKLRDTTYPQAIERAPLLIGRSIQPDYEDWPPVEKLDETLLASVDDKSYWPGDKAWHTLEEDQTPALWHLAAFARDTAGKRSAEEWRRTTTMNAHDVHQRLIDGALPRGTPLRVFGSLIRRTTSASPTNPAGIQFWTVAWVQVREYGGQLIPIWVPKRVRELPDRAQLEVRGYYYRWFAYESVQNDRFRVPLFVAADLDVYELHVDRTMRSIGMWLGGAVCAFLGLILWSQRRAGQEALAHSRDLDQRRRRRRERAGAQAGTGQTGSPS
ncbi:MAG: hypothetical protein WAT39_11120 [Planctomycetota bacterium]